MKHIFFLKEFKFKKSIHFFLFTLFIILNIHSQTNNIVKASVLKSTITSVGSSSVSITDNNYLIAQSIGQSSIIGKIDASSISVQQGFLNNVIFFKVNNSKDNFIDEILDFVIFPNPFSEYIKIKFSEKTKQDIYIKIYDINGKIFNNSKYLPTDNIVIPLNRLSLGNYLIQIKSGRNTVTKKIVKKGR